VGAGAARSVLGIADRFAGRQGATAVRARRLAPARAWSRARRFAKAFMGAAPGADRAISHLRVVRRRQRCHPIWRIRLACSCSKLTASLPAKGGRESRRIRQRADRCDLAAANARAKVRRRRRPAWSSKSVWAGPEVSFFVICDGKAGLFPSVRRRITSGSSIHDRGPNNPAAWVRSPPSAPRRRSTPGENPG